MAPYEKFVLISAYFIFGLIPTPLIYAFLHHSTTIRTSVPKAALMNERRLLKSYFKKTDREEDKGLKEEKKKIEIKEKSSLGIGGKGGIIYDVNKVKRNLVQEAVQESKKELIELLATPRNGSNRTHQDMIESKIVALLEANPVSTTTDSNLLQGLWGFTYLADNASMILGESRFQSRNRLQKRGGVDSISDQTDKDYYEVEEKFLPWKGKTGKTENPLKTSSRLFNLEDLDDEEDPYMIDSNSLLNGLWCTKRKYDVVGLTRTSLELKLKTTSKYFCSKLVREKEGGKDKTGLGSVDIQFLYLDSDLCISMVGREKPKLLVHTKSKAWIGNSERVKRKMRFLVATISWIFRLRKFRKNKSEGQNIVVTEESEILLRRNYTDTDSKLTVLRLGDVTDNPVSNAAWDGEEDPFIHLSAVERQETMKKMSLEQIGKAGEEQKKIIKEQRKNLYRKQKKFKRPS